eukprot:109726-Amphidinium_carterae.1
MPPSNAMQYLYNEPTLDDVTKSRIGVRSHGPTERVLRSNSCAEPRRTAPFGYQLSVVCTPFFQLAWYRALT